MIERNVSFISNELFYINDEPHQSYINDIYFFIEEFCLEMRDIRLSMEINDE